MRKIALTGLLAVSLIAAAPIHGIEVEMKWEIPAILATCTYSGGMAVTGADVKIYSPADAEGEFQTGKTDVNGVFAFVPDTAGEWRFVVDDGMGHREESTFLLPEGFLESGGTVPSMRGGAEEAETGPVTGRGLVRVSIVGIAVLILVIALIVMVRLRT